jgi:3-hydroxyacyl-[acyl-carrier-protein] dehydratase
MAVSLPLGRAEIEQILPHRQPFLLIDEVVELTPGVGARARKEVRADDWYLAGHFPGRPVMPGVLIVEALAQTGAVLVMQDRAHAGKVPFFARIDNCRFRQQVRPGDTLRLEVDVTSFRDPVGKAHARALVGDTLACEADLTFALGSVESSA